MSLFDKYMDSVMFDHPCPPGCETCCPLDIQLEYDNETNILTLTYIYDNATVIRQVDLSDLQEELEIDLEFNAITNIVLLSGSYGGVPFSSQIDITHSHNLQLSLNGSILVLDGEHDGVNVQTTVDLAGLIPQGLFFSESNIVYKATNTTLLTSEYIVVATGTVTLEMPSNPVLGQMYKIYCSTNTVTLVPQPGATILNAASLVISGNDGIIIQYIKSNYWGVIKI